MTRLGQQRGHLTPVMRLVIEQVSDQHPGRQAARLVVYAAGVRQGLSEPAFGELGCPQQQGLVSQVALASQLLEVSVEVLTQGGQRRWTAREAPQPGAIAVEQVI